eukprot:m.233958 g.233958  ORF g.233958 m.233958 type:complete len:104 (-) comp10884_c0_seq8:11-322(-)
MRTLRHRNVVLFYGAGNDHGSPFLVTEFMGNGSLDDVLRSDIELVWDRRLQFALDAARGLCFLHAQSPPCIHRDIKVLKWRELCLLLLLLSCFFLGGGGQTLH